MNQIPLNGGYHIRQIKKGQRHVRPVGGSQSRMPEMDNPIINIGLNRSFEKTGGGQSYNSKITCID